MTSFFVANFVDISVTSFGLDLEGFQEKGLSANAWVEDDQLATAAILRTGVTAVLIGLYALNKELNTRFAFSYEKALNISNFIVWGINLSNIAQVAYHLYETSS